MTGDGSCPPQSSVARLPHPATTIPTSRQCSTGTGAVRSREWQADGEEHTSDELCGNACGSVGLDDCGCVYLSALRWDAWNILWFVVDLLVWLQKILKKDNELSSSQ